VVTFHPLAEDATLLVLVLEYHPKGVLEHLGNLVRAQGRRVRLDLKRFQAFVTWQDGSEADAPPAQAGSADSDEGSAPEPGSETVRADRSEEDEG
jgi:hypothetical protein